MSPPIDVEEKSRRNSEYLRHSCSEAVQKRTLGTYVLFYTDTLSHAEVL